MIYNSRVYLPYENLLVDLSGVTPATSQHHYHQITLHDIPSRFNAVLKQAYLFPAVRRKKYMIHLYSVDVYCDVFIAKKSRGFNLAIKQLSEN